MNEARKPTHQYVLRDAKSVILLSGAIKMKSMSFIDRRLILIDQLRQAISNALYIECKMVTEVEKLNDLSHL